MAGMLAELAGQWLPQMDPDERRAALEELRAMIDEEFFKLAQEGTGVDLRCPHCGCPRFVKRGLDAAGGQRYLCRGCGRTFTARTRRVFATTKLERGTWMRFAECHVDALSLRESARRCGVGLKTAFFMRHRVLEATAKSMPAFRAEAGSGSELDECYLRESFKGNHDLGGGIPRPPHRRSGACDGLERICVVTGVNDAGDMFYEIAGRGNLTYGAAVECLAGKLAAGAIVSTDRANVYRRALADLGVGGHLAEPRGAHSINRVNNLHRNMRDFLAHFHGVSTRRLANYLAWFKWAWSFRIRRSAAQLAELIVKQATGNTYETSWRGYRATPYPFYDYWVKQAGWDATARAALGNAS